MKRLLLILLFAAIPCYGQAVHTAQFGVATRIDFELYNADGTLSVDEVDGGAESRTSCDEGSLSTATNDFVDEGTFYSLLLTDGELECARTVVSIGATLTTVFIIETFGDIAAHDKARGVASGTAQSGTASTIVLDATTNIADDLINNRIICLTGGTGAGQCRLVSNWVSISDTVSVSSDWTTNPAVGTAYIVHPANQSSLQAFADVVAATLLTLETASSVTPGDVGYQLGTVLNSIESKVNTVDAVVDALTTDMGYTVLARGTIDASTTTSLDDGDVLNVADHFWNNYAAVSLNGEPPRCIRATSNVNTRITWTPAMQSAPTGSYAIVFSPTCRNFP